MKINQVKVKVKVKTNTQKVIKKALIVIVIKTLIVKKNLINIVMSQMILHRIQKIEN